MSVKERYKKSEDFLIRALKSIPLGSQTFSKSVTQYPKGVSPFFINKAKGSRVWDVDGNEYIDFVNSLAAITLGYNDPDVTKAVEEQLKEGIIFSLSNPIETKVAEKIIEMVPCAEKVRFGKNGSDATSGAIRVARAFTNKDHVLVCGYHGWQDWYIGSTARNKGVPKVVQNLTHSFIYNDLDSLENLFKEYKENVAAVILEPMNVSWPENHFLEKVKDLTHKNKALLVFDETITGFRYANGGAQEYFNVTPDLATFGKGMANGYPVSAVVGKDEYMKEMEEIFFSFTFGGETLSLAAADATLKKLTHQPVCQTINKNGEFILEQVKNKVKNLQLEEVMKPSGHPTWSMLNMQDHKDFSKYEIQTYFLQEMFKNGILTLGTHNISYAHTQEDINKLLCVYDVVFTSLKEAIQTKTLRKRLDCKPLEPLFKVR